MVISAGDSTYSAGSLRFPYHFHCFVHELDNEAGAHGRIVPEELKERALE
jgi:hypothetical protein